MEKIFKLAGSFGSGKDLIWWANQIALSPAEMDKLQRIAPGEHVAILFMDADDEPVYHNLARVS